MCEFTEQFCQQESHLLSSRSLDPAEWFVVSEGQILSPLIPLFFSTAVFKKDGTVHIISWKATFCQPEWEWLFNQCFVTLPTENKSDDLLCWTCLLLTDNTKYLYFETPKSWVLQFPISGDEILFKLQQRCRLVFFCECSNKVCVGLMHYFQSHLCTFISDWLLGCWSGFVQSVVWNWLTGEPTVIVSATSIIPIKMPVS